MSEQEPEVLEVVDAEGAVDHGDTSPTDAEAEQGRMLCEEIDPDDDESGSEGG